MERAAFAFWASYMLIGMHPNTFNQRKKWQGAFFFAI
jgi:hypothetical protein